MWYEVIYCLFVLRSGDGRKAETNKPRFQIITK